MAKRKKDDRGVVSFELQEDMLELLDQDAKARSAKSRHIRAREIVVQGLSHNDSEDLAQLVGELDVKLAGLKTMMQRLCYVFLVHGAGKPPADANTWIRDHFSV